MGQDHANSLPCLGFSYGHAKDHRPRTMNSRGSFFSSVQKLQSPTTSRRREKPSSSTAPPACSADTSTQQGALELLSSITMKWPGVTTRFSGLVRLLKHLQQLPITNTSCELQLSRHRVPSAATRLSKTATRTVSSTTLSFPSTGTTPSPSPQDLMRRMRTQAEDDSGVSSPLLWKMNPPRKMSAKAPHFQPLDHHYNPSPRSQAIADGRRELMEVIKDASESAYELSLKGIVELQSSKVARATLAVETDLSGETSAEEK